MQSVNSARACLTRGILSASHLQKIVTVPSRSYYKKKWTYDNKYQGQFDLHDQGKYPRRMGGYKEEELLDEIHAIRRIENDNPSPFHIIRRVRGFETGRLPWFQKVTLRRLNLHSLANGDVVIVPNTPQFNAMIDKVKHLIQLKPAVFPDGKMPTEDDLGALKVCPYTGTVQVDEKLRLRANRLNLEKPLMFQGNFLRHKLSKLHGTRHGHYMA